DARSTTQLKISYLDNTKLPDKIDVTTKDNVADTINKIGKVAVALAPMIATGVSASGVAAAAPTFRDTVLDPGEVKAGEWVPDGMNPGSCLMLGDVSVEDGLSMTEYIKNR